MSNVQISLVGISHKTAPVAVREHFALGASELPAALARLGQGYSAAAVLSTCNRTEVYVAAPRTVGDPRSIVALLSEVKGKRALEGAPFVVLNGKEAARHLFRVAAGVDSMVIGESEILGQVRAAFAAATVAGTNNVALSRLFHTAIRVGRRARSQTSISRHSVSVSSTAVSLARSIFGDLSTKTVLVVSAGEAGKLTARSLADSGVAKVLVTNRNEERARELATDIGAEVVPFGALSETIARADIVITSTASAQFLIDGTLTETAMRRRSRRDLLLIDIAVPRDVDPSVRDIPGVHLYDIDGLQGIMQTNMHLRRAELAEVEAIVDEAVAKFSDWMRSLEVVPTISAVRSRAEAVRVAELERTLAKANVSATDRKRIDALTSAIVKKILHEPIARLKSPGEGVRYVESMRALFDLDGDD